MAEKGEPASGWPIVQGDFHTGDAKSPVAVVTMGSHLDEAGICSAGAAIAGSCKTEKPRSGEGHSKCHLQPEHQVRNYLWY